MEGQPVYPFGVEPCETEEEIVGGATGFSQGIDREISGGA